MIAPKPFVAVCKKCGKVKIIAPKSDVLSVSDICPHCDKCGEPMQKGFGGAFSKALNELVSVFFRGKGKV